MSGAAERFAFSGRVGGRFVLAGLSGLGLAGLGGLLYQRLLDASPWVVLHPFVTLLFGLLLGVLGVAVLRLGQVRRSAVMRLVAWTLPLVALLLGHLEALGVGRAGFDSLGAALGRALAPPPDSGRVGGSTLVLLWLAELGVVTGMSAALVHAWWQRAVYDEDAAVFLVRRRIALRYGPSPRSLRQAFEDEGLSAMRALRSLPENAEEGEFRVYVHDPVDPDHAWMTVQWVGKLDGPRGRKVLRDVMVLRRLRVPRTFLAELGYPAGSCAP